MPLAPGIPTLGGLDPGGRMFFGMPYGAEFGETGGSGSILGGRSRLSRQAASIRGASPTSGGFRLSAGTGGAGGAGGNVGAGPGGFIGTSPGSGGGSPSYSREGFQQPEPISAETPVNPMEGYAFDRAKDYEANLAAGTNEEITRELQRARDDISVGMKAEGEAAMGRGADAGLFRTRALEAGKRDIHNLQGRLADVALGRRADAIGRLTSAGGQAAEGQRALHFGSLASRLADQRYQLDAAESQARLNQAPYDRLMRMMDSIGRYSGMLGDDSAGMLGGGGFGASAGPASPFGGWGRSSRR